MADGRSWICEQSDGPGQRTSQIKVVLGFIKDFPGHGRFFPRSCGVRISDVGALALALAMKPPSWRPADDAAHDIDLGLRRKNSRKEGSC